jgi:hypothetical protein
MRKLTKDRRSAAAPSVWFALLSHGIPARRSEIAAGSWDAAGLRGTGSFDWIVDKVFLPERRTMPQAGIPLESQWGIGREPATPCRCIAGSGRTTAG